MTWGVSDYVDEKGESDGKFSISLNFPNEEYKTDSTEQFLEKLKAFEEQLLDDAVNNSRLWWGEDEKLERSVVKHSYFPFLKYSKNRETKKIDYSKPPCIRAKVPYYDGKWGVEIYDTKSNLIFPCENQHMTPRDLIPSLSSVACVLNCNGIWIGGKGWGLTWKLIQCVVKPRVVQSVYGKCHINLSVEDRDVLESQVINEEANPVEDSNPHLSHPLNPKKPEPVPVLPSVPEKTFVEDSDDEMPKEEEPATEEEEEPVKEMPPPSPVAVKKIIKKSPEPAAVEVQAATAPVKKVVKKTVKA